MAIELPPSGSLPSEFRLREAEIVDAAAVAEVLTAAFGDPWSVERVLGELLQNELVPNTYVIERDGAVVASTSYQLIPAFPDGAFLHWVGVHPSAQGHRLSHHLCLRVLERTKDAKLPMSYLTTDDFRLPAILTYLRLGYEPDFFHESHPERWQNIREKLEGMF